MKKLLRVNNNPQAVDISLLIARLGIGTLMLTHGLPKLAMLLSGESVQFPGIMGISPEVSLGLAVFAEVMCSLLIIAGLGTRLAALPLIITMAVAAFYIHAADGFAKQELAVQYLLVYVVLLFAGSGKYSADNLLQRKATAVADNQQIQAAR